MGDIMDRRNEINLWISLDKNELHPIKDNWESHWGIGELLHQIYQESYSKIPENVQKSLKIACS